jgi:SAM-dependent methyltransferase
LATSTAELNAAEHGWWQKFAELEERYCWVQTPAIQRFLRGDYLRVVMDAASGNQRVLELGCGSGWLTVLLARMGVRDIVGADFSEAQIQLAEERAAQAGVTDRVRFHLADVAGLRHDLGTFDLVIIHAFLHHLAVDELRGVIENVGRVLSPHGRLLILEPVLYPAQSGPTRGGWLVACFRLLMRLGRFQRLPFGHRRWVVRQLGAAERDARSLMAERSVGLVPRGPSPKEMPFEPSELPELLAPWFRVERRRRCMGLSQGVAQETLLLELSCPTLARAIRWPLLAAARQADRALLSLEPPPPDVWIFELFECTPAAPSGAVRASDE